MQLMGKIPAKRAVAQEKRPNASRRSFCTARSAEFGRWRNLQARWAGFSKPILNETAKRVKALGAEEGEGEGEEEREPKLSRFCLESGRAGGGLSTQCAESLGAWLRDPEDRHCRRRRLRLALWFLASSVFPCSPHIPSFPRRCLQRRSDLPTPPASTRFLPCWSLVRSYVRSYSPSQQLSASEASHLCLRYTDLHHTCHRSGRTPFRPRSRRWHKVLLSASRLASLTGLWLGVSFGDLDKGCL